jgi:N-acetylglucosaminyldiphosphoundecaprenol N-acetyl-beta-D-mannosaminyltransferase
VQIAGIPVDAVDMPQALSRLGALLGTGRLGQVCTINLDFLVGAQRNAETRGIFQRGELNLPDGWPVVWLGRLQGSPMPSRVAGADLVPQLVRLAAERGAGVFLLGGEHGVAERAAARLRELHPGLRVDWYEPPRAAIDAMDNAEIVARIRASGADILMVAFGHPKQDRWIDQHRDQLPVSVAIGVGCAFDLIAGRVRRAPRWMQDRGLEWLFRMLQEPRRLSGRYLHDTVRLLPLAFGIALRRLTAR